MNTFTLEYSKGQKQWHHNYGHSPVNTNGFHTVAENCTLELAAGFFKWLDTRFPKGGWKVFDWGDKKFEYEAFYLPSVLNENK